MADKRFPRYRRQFLLAGLAAAMMVFLPVLGLPHPLTGDAVAKTSLPGASSATEDGGRLTPPTDALAIGEAGVFDIEIRVDAGTSGAFNRGDMVSRAVSEHVEKMARSVADATPVFAEERCRAYVRATQASAYSHPTTDAPHTVVFEYGDVLTVTGRSDGWVQIESEGETWYVPAVCVTDEPVFTPVAQTLYVWSTDEADLKLYAEPSCEGEVLKEIWFADRVTAIAAACDWYQVVTEAKVEGYLPASILTTDIVFAQGSYKMYCLQELAVYIQPDPAAEVVHYYDKNDAVQVTGYSFDWIRVLTSEDEVGYIQMEKVTDTAPYTPPPYTPPVYTPPPPPAFTPGTYANANVQAVINKALSYVGCPYVLGGVGYGGIDCSGLAMRAYEAAGIYITRSSYAYWGVGYSVSFSDLRPGDIVCYDSEWNGSIGHVAIYIGNGQVVHAMNEWRGVGVSSVYFGGYNIMTVRRLIG